MLRECYLKCPLADTENKLIQKPYEEGDECGLKLVQAILKPLMLWRTKDSTEKDGMYRYRKICLFLLFYGNWKFRPILVLTPTNVQ